MLTKTEKISDSETEPGQEALPSHQTWRPLRLFNLYRLLISGSFVIYALSNFSIKAIGQYNPLLFKTVAVIYFVTSILNIFTIQRRRPEFSIQVHTQVIVDIVAITLFMYASGGVQSGIGMLIIVAVAGGSILLAGKAALGFAAIASLLILGEHIYIQINDPLMPTA